MGTIVRRNERSWAIDIIAEIRAMLRTLNIKIKSAGGESTLSVNKKSMFPDVLLYEDKAQNKILQGWELKMPDVLITDEALIKDATRKANALSLNSFVIWNFTYGKLYIKDETGHFVEAKVWNGTDHIKKREDVKTYKSEWLPIIKDIVMTVNEYLVKGTIAASSITTSVSDGLTAELILRNKEMVAENLVIEVSKSMPMESRLKIWWKAFHEEYDKDEKDMYAAYAKSILLNWTNRIMFANVIKKYHNCAYKIDEIDTSTTPDDGNKIIQEIVKEGDFYNVFKQLDFNEIVPEDTWVDIASFNQFLVSNHIDKIDQGVLQEILEKTVKSSKREIRGQFATPYYLADLLCQVTVTDWTSNCADLCAGTGTIAKALIDNKRVRLQNSDIAFETTWIADKYAYPLQLANIAVTNIEAINVLINMFQSDVFEVVTGQGITLKSPIDGSEVEKEIPKFQAIVSNLPFVEYNKIADDENDFIERYRQRIKEDTGIEFTQGKTDLYNYLPFKLYELLDDEGRLGVILSNSWLGTDIGKKFFDALQYYYTVESVVISNCGRWFKNADVVATLLVMQKKEIGKPNPNNEISFWLTNVDVSTCSDKQRESIVNSIVLHDADDIAVISNKKYTLESIENILSKGVTINSLFHDVSWIKELEDSLIPISNILEVKRGERRGWNDLFYPKEGHGIEPDYICPVLKNPALLTSYNAVTDIQAFCCHKSKEELKSLGHTGALEWIEKFENIKNGSGKLLPIALKRSGHFWYEMNDSAKADFVTALNPDKRLFVSKFETSTFVDQRFTRMLIKREDISADLIHALLNSVYGMFAIEAIGFGRGLGVLDASSTKLKNMYMINPDVISDSDAMEIVSLLNKIKNRKVMNTEDELKDKDREKFDRKVLQAIGHEELYGAIKESLLSMQHTRHTVKL